MRHRLISALLLLAAAGCTSVQTVQQYEGAPLPRPDRVLVYDFAYSPGQVKLDRGLSADIARAIQGSPRTAQELEVGRKVADVVAEHLVKQIRDMGLPAQRASGPPPTWGDTLAVEGQFLSIDEGNRTERVVIGLGLGRTSVETHVQLYRDTAGGQQILEQLDVDAKSGRKPGMAETMGAGAAAGHLLVSAVVSTGLSVASETLSDTVEADAGRTAKNVAEKLKAFFQQQGWI